MSPAEAYRYNQIETSFLSIGAHLNTSILFMT